jgi:hypothetical protein
VACHARSQTRFAPRATLARRFCHAYAQPATAGRNWPAR